MRAETLGRFAAFGVFFLVMVLVDGAHGASDLEDARRWYRDGDFVRAAEFAVQEDTAAGFALAARAMLAYTAMSFFGEERRANIELADSYARQAIALDPEYLEGHLERAVALGYLGRSRGAIAAYFAGMADEARGHVAFVLERAPDNAWAHAIFGAWHLEIERSAGTWFAKRLYGASSEAGIGYFEKAIELAPDNPTLYFQFAVQLLDFDLERNRARGLELLEQAHALTPRDAHEAFMHRQARDLAAALETQDENRVTALVCEIQGDCPAARESGQE